LMVLTAIGILWVGKYDHPLENPPAGNVHAETREAGDLLAKD
jgi:hypothetical protein